MDKEKLSQLYYLNREIEVLKKQLDSVEPEFVSDSIKGSSIEFPYTEHSIKIKGIGWDEYEAKTKRIKNKIKNRVSELMNLKDEINDYIEKIPDSELRLIISLRYINGLSWQQVASHIGNMGDGSTERKKHDRFLNVSQNSRKEYDNV